MSVGRKCHVYMKQDVAKVGMTGQVVNVQRGFAENYLVKSGLAVIIDKNELATFEKRDIKFSETKEVLETATSMLAERIKTTTVIIKEKIHDKDKLYGSIKEIQIVDALKEKGIPINKKQVVFGKLIKTSGEHQVTIRLSSRLQPELTVKIVSL